MPNVLELRKSRKELVARMAPLAEKSALSPDEAKSFDELKAQAEELVRQIERAEYVEGQRAIVEKVEPVAARPAPDGSLAPKGPRIRVENPGFESLGEMIQVHVRNPEDRRVKALMEMKTGTSGGMAVPDEFLGTLLQVPPSMAIVRPRATVLPQGASPDAEVTMPALEQGSGSNIYGGVAVSWVAAEGDDSAETSATLREVSLAPKEVAANIVVTQKLLRNWQGASSAIETLMRNALIAAEDVAFLSGNGVGRPLGVLNAGCLKSVNRLVANTVGYEDLVKMEDEFEGAGDAPWIVTRRAVKKLRLLEDNGGHLIWNENAREGGTPTLLGRPVQISFRSPALGSKGDVLLADLSYYLIRDGAAVTVAASEHALFKGRKVIIQIAKSVDGQPWLNGAVAQEDSQTYSPFVALDVP